MEVGIRRIKHNLCRCCHVEGEFPNFSELKNDSDELDYPRMLLECLNVTIAQVPGDSAQKLYSICEECLNRLKDAISFKKQILVCEIKLMNLIKNNLIVTVNVKKEEDGDFKPDNIIKKEPDDAGDDEHEVYYPASDSDNEGGSFINVKIEEVPPSPKSSKTNIRNQPKRQATKKDVDLKGSVKKVTAKRVAAKKVAPKKKASEKVVPKKKTTETVPSTPKTKTDGDSQNKGLVQFYLRETDYTVSDDGTVYTCSRCNQHYKTTDTLRFHVKHHHYNIPKYKCPKCPELFKTLVPFVQHKYQEHHIDHRIHCNACDQAFSTKVMMKRHLETFHMLGPKRKCTSCNFETFSDSAYRKHHFKHKESKDYHCKFCEKSFLRKTTLQFHERIHTGDRRKVCSVCGQAFIQKASLNYHMTKYHPNVNL